MIYRWPGFLWFYCMIRLLARTPFAPLSRQQLVSLSQSSCVSPIELTDGRGKRRTRSQIMRRRESLVLYKSFNTLCLECWGVRLLAMIDSGASFLCVHQLGRNVSFMNLFWNLFYYITIFLQAMWLIVWSVLYAWKVAHHTNAYGGHKIVNYM
jgi:hypothetical protein